MESNVFHMAVADTVKFEEKLRDVEQRLGIKEGVPVTYERNNDFASKILISLIVFTVVLSLLSRMGGMKTPISMDSFVSLSLSCLYTFLLFYINCFYF